MTPKESKLPVVAKVMNSLEDLVKMDATIDMDSISAIRVAQLETQLLEKQDKLRAEIRTKEADRNSVNQKLQKAFVDDARDNNPDIAKLEEMGKSMFGKTFSISVTRSGDRVQVQCHGGTTHLPWKGDKSKGLDKEHQEIGKEIGKIEGQIVEVKKGLGMMANVERRARAAVAVAKLSRTEEGKEILKSLDTINVPGLPAPKAK